jgi:hypothetical protein
MNFSELSEKEIVAICEELSCDKDEVENFIDSDDYSVLTEEEANEKASSYIKDSLWAFNPSFLSEETGIDKSVFKAISDNGKCESNNDAIESIIKGCNNCDMESFIESAIGADGRGHFLSNYDGNEIELHPEGRDIYIYRNN